MSDLIPANYDLTTYDPQPSDQNPALVFLARHPSQHTRRAYKRCLDVVASILGANDAASCAWGKVRFQHVAAVRSVLSSMVAEKTGRPLNYQTVNLHLIALRGVLKTAWKLGQMSSDDFQRAVAVESVEGYSLPAGRHLGSGEIGAIMASCERDNTAAGVRDAAIIGCLYTCGLRRSEVVKLDLSDFDQETGALTIRAAKGNKDRFAYLTNGAARAMGDWLAVRGGQPGALFYPVNKGANIQPRRMSDQAVYNLLAKRGDQAGVKDFACHDFRRTFVSDLLDAGADIATVAKMAGHKSVSTTANYDRRPEAAKQKAAGLLHLPYHGKH